MIISETSEDTIFVRVSLLHPKCYFMLTAKLSIRPAGSTGHPTEETIGFPLNYNQPHLLTSVYQYCPSPVLERASETTAY